jgi:hypothetical protein
VKVAKAAKRRTPAEGSHLPVGSEVDAFMGALVHPLKADIETARQTVLGADAAIGEAVKWNAPSFRTTEFFATVNLRSRDQVQFVFHRGAKVRAVASKLELADPAGIVTWLAKDRCLVTVGAGKAFAAKRDALRTLVQEWIKHV